MSGYYQTNELKSNVEINEVVENDTDSQENPFKEENSADISENPFLHHQEVATSIRQTQNQNPFQDEHEIVSYLEQEDDLDLIDKTIREKQKRVRRRKILVNCFYLFLILILGILAVLALVYNAKRNNGESSSTDDDSSTELRLI